MLVSDYVPARFHHRLLAVPMLVSGTVCLNTSLLHPRSRLKVHLFASRSACAVTLALLLTADISIVFVTCLLSTMVLLGCSHTNFEDGVHQSYRHFVFKLHETMQSSHLIF